MSLILGILAQSAGAAGAANSYESIATVTVGSGGASDVTFTSIPSTYTNLQIRFLARSSGSPDTKVQYNSDTTTTNYRTHLLYGDGSSVTASTLANTAYVGYIATASNTFGASVVDVLDYTNTNKYKTAKSLAGYDANGSGYIILYSHLWMSTSAITSIKIYPDSGNFTQYSQFALYGIKGV
jgi:hypothetical protein